MKRRQLTLIALIILELLIILVYIPYVQNDITYGNYIGEFLGKLLLIPLIYSIFFNFEKYRKKNNSKKLKLLRVLDFTSSLIFYEILNYIIGDHIPWMAISGIVLGALSLSLIIFFSDRHENLKE